MRIEELRHGGFVQFTARLEPIVLSLEDAQRARKLLDGARRAGGRSAEVAEGDEARPCATRFIGGMRGVRRVSRGPRFDRRAAERSEWW